uniref:Uncharacterized protein n=1 Tax=uncultured marine virus TaxID=186617 RepID=A0A0F7L101_9VIRU|nr:hypothetical protein [uncultured marine virus]
MIAYFANLSTILPPSPFPIGITPTLNLTTNHKIHPVILAFCDHICTDKASR